MSSTLAEVIAEARRLGIDPCPYCGHADDAHAVIGRTVGCQAGDGSAANPICGCRKLRGELTHEMGAPRAPHPDPDIVSFWLEHGPLLARVAEAAVGMREVFPRGEEYTSVLAAFDAAVRGEP